MGSKKKQKVEPKKGAGGRPAGTPNWLKEEHLACALAAIEAKDMKQTQSGLDLVATAEGLYARNLKNVVEPTYGWPARAGTKAKQI